MKQLLYYVPKSIDDAAAYLAKNSNAAPIAGGTELLHSLKQYNLPNEPTTLVDLKAIPGLDTITESGGMLKIGPNATLATIAASSTVQGNYRALAQAAGKVASPLLRNMGTIAGNIGQDVWCWYYRGADNVFNCIRKGGAVCYAQAGDNRFYHSIFGGPKGCYAVSPTDTGVALAALNASVVTTKQTLTMDKFFVETAPGNTLAAGELIKEIDVPTPAAGSKSAFVKLAIRDSIDFSLASAGVWYTPGTSAVTDCRIFLGGVYQTPRRSAAAETALKGQTISATTATTVGQAAVSDASPMTMNSYKKNLASVAVARALQL
ncbi:MAG TPA: FAD binding domain-containing protein [Conexivisphaerales archaeon]|nr:FAD binding domain-containing protein [Conexivisphaerales archaeon]